MQGPAEHNIYTLHGSSSAGVVQLAHLFNPDCVASLLVAREHPAVHSWDIINEPRAKSDAKSSQIAEWIDEMASSIKRWDPMHPVGLYFQ
jgi:endo-1,4-beta-mannosidase